MVAATVFSDHGAGRKPRQRWRGHFWAFIRGLIAFVVTLITLLASAWLGGNLRQQQAAKLSQAVHVEETRELPMVLPDAVGPPAPPAVAQPARRPEPAYEPVSLFPHSDGIEVLSAEELASISQAHRARPAP